MCEQRYHNKEQHNSTNSCG